MEERVTEPPEREPTHPGAILREDVLPALRLSVSEAARQLGVSRQTLHRIIAGTHPVTPEMALRLGRLCGNDARLWLRMQGEHDLWQARRRLAEELEQIPGGDLGLEFARQMAIAEEGLARYRNTLRALAE